jgi:hypothetical protein
LRRPSIIESINGWIYFQPYSSSLFLKVEALEVATPNSLGDILGVA